MKGKLYIVLLIFFAIIIKVTAQENDNLNIPNKIYSDRLTDENGNPLDGITILVKNKGLRTTTNSDGVFSIDAKNGDIIELRKNGKFINTYRLNGSIYYRIEDESGQFESKGSKKVSFYKSRESDNSANFQQFIDSATFYNRKNPIKSINFISAALLQVDNNNKDQLAQSYAVLGDVYMNLQQYDLAVSNYKIATENEKNSAIEIKLARAYLRNKEYENSKNKYESILNSGSISNDQKIEIHEGLGDINFKIKEYQLALSQYQKALNLAKSGQKNTKITDLNIKISAVLEATGQIAKAEGFLLQPQVNAAKGNSEKSAIQSQNAAEFYSRNNNIDKEVQQRKITLKNIEEAELNEVVMEDEEAGISKPKVKYDLGNALLKQKNYVEAIPMLEESAAEAENSSDILTQKDAVQRLSEAYATLGDDSKALSNYRQYVAIVDKLYQQKEDEINAVVALNRDLSEKQNRITSLEKDRELSESKFQLYQTENQLTLENDRRQKLIIYALLSGLVLLLFSLFWMIRSNKQKKFANNLLALKSLRTQMNPHFIFNALNSVNSFIAQNDERTANRYLTDFSTLMRSVLNNSEEDFIALEKEIELLELYLKLEHSRFQDKFDYELIVDKNIDQGQFQIPPMLLQPYVENAVWHGLRYKKEKGFLKVSLSKVDEETIRIEISDNGIGREKSKALKTEYQKKQKSKGMQNIKQRIKILNEMYKDKVDVFIEDMYDDKTGTKIVLTLKRD